MPMKGVQPSSSHGHAAEPQERTHLLSCDGEDPARGGGTCNQVRSCVPAAAAAAGCSSATVATHTAQCIMWRCYVQSRR